jgi:hypothetical protein
VRTAHIYHSNQHEILQALEDLRVKVDGAVKQIDKQPHLINQAIVSSGLVHTTGNVHSTLLDVLILTQHISEQPLLQQHTMPPTDTAPCSATPSRSTTAIVDLPAIEAHLFRQDGPIQRCIHAATSSTASPSTTCSPSGYNGTTVNWERAIVIPYPSAEQLQERLFAALNALNMSARELLLRIFLVVPLLHQFFQVLRRIPAIPTMLLTDSIMFEDALGRRMSLPFEHFCHFSVFLHD